jgi:hypothetical protein
VITAQERAALFVVIDHPWCPYRLPLFSSGTYSSQFSLKAIWIPNLDVSIARAKEFISGLLVA